ncbi:hypothetical protein V6N11_058647 [Hibiscus sabdariffa]|uniref:Uncharacterized protein n=1 Tax=Hibiscus sabdariffa TaxID=183260 RepID=A0ABR2U4Z9_9ROSI
MPLSKMEVEVRVISEVSISPISDILSKNVISNGPRLSAKSNVKIGKDIKAGSIMVQEKIGHVPNLFIVQKPRCKNLNYVNSPYFPSSPSQLSLSVKNKDKESEFQCDLARKSLGNHLFRLLARNGGLVVKDNMTLVKGKRQMIMIFHMRAWLCRELIQALTITPLD